MGKYEQLAKDIIKNVGGKENINGLTHCITRLRFKLKDESKANDDILKNMDGVVTVMHSAGQYQVVIGNHVPNVYADVCEVAGIGGDAAESEGDAPKGVFNKLIDIISGCFQPILGPLVACGIVKGINALLVFLMGETYSASGTYLVLNAIGDSVFYFMPILLGYSAAKKFGVNVVVGMLIGGVLCYPSIQAATLSTREALGTIGILGDYYTTFLNIPMVATDYTNSVIPVVVVVAFASVVQKYAKKYIPEIVQNFFVPFLVLIISLPIGLLVIGPVVELFTNLLSMGFTNMFNFSPVVTGIVLGLFWQVLIIFGLHWSAVPVAMINITNLGYDTLLMVTHPAAFAQTAALFAMYLKMKDKKKKMLALPAIASGLCGVTEPSIYGYTLPAKTPFIASMVGAAVGNGMMCMMGVKRYIMGAGGVFGMVNYISPEGDVSGMYISLLCIGVAMIIGFALTFIFWKDTSEGNKIENYVSDNTVKVSKEIVVTPMEGKVKPLSDIKDTAFACGALGKGIAIKPSNGKVVAPFDGTVMTLFPTKHAIGLISDNGCEVLIHIGLDTVQLEGKYFEAHVKQGDKVKQGQILVTFDKEAIEKEGYCIDSPIIITNTSDYLDVVETQDSNVKKDDQLMIVLL